MTQPPSLETPDPGATTPETEWTFLKDGQVFGPVPASRLKELLYQGEIDATTQVSEDGARYRRVCDVSRFLVDLKKAEVHLKVEREITDSRRLETRRRRAQGAVGLVLGIAAAVVGLGGAAWLATARPWQKRSALLADFGQGIAISMPARIASARQPPQAELGEVAVPVEPGAPPRPAPRPRERPAAVAPAAAAQATGGDLVLAQWDAADIQTVVGREQRTLAPCLREEARRSPDFAGEIPVEFAVGNEGKVASLWIDEPRFRRGPLHECLLRALQAWRFKPFPGQQPVISLSFRIGSG